MAKYVGSTVKIGKWEVPRSLYEQYILWTQRADGYASGKTQSPSGQALEQTMRWSACVTKVMEIHREICKVIKVEYTTDEEDGFYSKFHAKVRKDLELKG